MKGATPPKPELLQVKLINYNFDYCGSNKAAFVDKFSNEIAAALPGSIWIWPRWPLNCRVRCIFGRE